MCSSKTTAARCPASRLSARTGKNVDRLLEMLALEAEILELKAVPEGMARGVVIESELDKGQGPVATVLVEKGTLRRGDSFVTGIHLRSCPRPPERARGFVESAGPSKPVLVLGITGTPQAGDSFKVVDDEKTAREIAARRRLAAKERELRRIGTVSLDYAMRYTKVFLDAIAYELAPVVVTSSEIEDRLAPLYRELGMTSGQLAAMTGIRERRQWEEGYPLYRGAAVAALKALGKSPVPANAIGTLIYGGVCRRRLRAGHSLPRGRGARARGTPDRSEHQLS